MKIECTRGIGKVEGPDGEDIDVEEPFEVDGETGEYILNNYPGMEVVEDDSETDKSGGSTGEDTDAEICGTEMTDGSLCQRPAGECPYHG